MECQASNPGDCMKNKCLTRCSITAASSFGPVSILAIHLPYTYIEVVNLLLLQNRDRVWNIDVYVAEKIIIWCLGGGNLAQGKAVFHEIFQSASYFFPIHKISKTQLKSSTCIDNLHQNGEAWFQGVLSTCK